ncbi:unnamed protein product [Plasmodium vivax]|uniref:(malaria parasite P. vivax) hypothetical protein n=1 Tax=Plasmodium vivax TaxID=5855 RepID=A0A8S4HFL8_PLAVI|nr:unnamed protein product [Plasmodium vivax]
MPHPITFDALVVMFLYKNDYNNSLYSIMVLILIHLNLDSVGLTSERFYYRLNHDDQNLEDHDSECRSLLSKKGLHKYNRICKKLLKFLKYSNAISDKEDSTYDDCILFNYWMYNEIAQRNNYDYTKKVNPVFGDLQFIWNSLIIDKSNESYFNKCKPDFYIPTQDDWKKRKQLYDYYVNSGTIVQIANSFPNTCEDIYRYIKGNSHLYKHFNERCSSENENQCPNFYNKCKKYHPDILLPKLTCYKNMQEKESASAESALSQRKQPELPEDGTFSSDDLQLGKDSSPPLIKTGDVLLGVVATTMTSGALYKFTPLGNMLRNRFGWNNNMRNFNGGDNGLFDYASEAFNPYSGEEHYI